MDILRIKETEKMIYVTIIREVDLKFWKNEGNNYLSNYEAVQLKDCL